MADVETPAAESSPAPTTTETPVELKIPTDPEGYAEWRQTGRLPGEKKESSSEEDESAPSKSAGDKPGKAAPVSDTGKPRQNRTDAETRKDELNREIRDLLAKRDALRQEVEPGTKKDVKAEPSPAPEAKRPTRPKQEDFDDWGAYQTAEDKYFEDLSDWKAAQKIEEHVQKLRQESATKEMQARLDEARERYGEEAEGTITTTAKTIFGDDKVAPALKAAIGRSQVIVDALYVMGSDDGELSEFLKLAKEDPIEALRKWFTVEALVKEELKNGTRGKAPAEAAPARGTDGRFLPPEKPDKPARREAPSPKTELNGNTSPSGDELDRAAKAGDFRAFKAEADRRDSARFRGQ